MAPRTASRLKLPRRFSSHLNATGVAYRKHYLALAEQYGPFATTLQKEAAADCAAFFVIKAATLRQWDEVHQKRLTGRGRRPSTRDITRAAKRAALDTSSYDTALNRLRALVDTKRTPDLAARLAATTHPPPA